MRACTTGSPGEANGSLSMITHESCSPATSTPCQNEAVARSTAPGRGAERLQQRRLGRLPLDEERIRRRCPAIRSATAFMFA